MYIWPNGPFFAQWLCPCGQCDHQPVFKTITWLLVSRLPRQNSLEPSEPCLQNLHQKQRNPPEPASGTYTSTHRNSPELADTLQNLQNLPEPSGTFRDLPPEPTPAHTRNLHQPQNSPELSGTLRNSPELSGTCLWNLHQHTPEPSGTNFRNLSPEPAPATRTGTHRSLFGLKTPWAYAVGEK